MSKLNQIRLLHTMIWMIEVSAILYILITGIMNIFNLMVIISFLLVIIEFIILLIYKWTCPLTHVAKSFTDDTHVGFDIFLPNWLAKHNKTIFTIIFSLGVVIHLIQFMI